jgi:hypothetical protein
VNINEFVFKMLIIKAIEIEKTFEKKPSMG